MNIVGNWIVMTADSGSSVNILDESHFYKKLTSQPTLDVTLATVCSYRSKSPLATLGKFDADIVTEDC